MELSDAKTHLQQQQQVQVQQQVPQQVQQISTEQQQQEQEYNIDTTAIIKDKAQRSVMAILESSMSRVSTDDGRPLEEDGWSTPVAGVPSPAHRNSFSTQHSVYNTYTSFEDLDLLDDPCYLYDVDLSSDTNSLNEADDDDEIFNDIRSSDHTDTDGCDTIDLRGDDIEFHREMPDTEKERLDKKTSNKLSNKFSNTLLNLNKEYYSSDWGPIYHNREHFISMHLR